MVNQDLQSNRREYGQRDLTVENSLSSPIEQFEQWFKAVSAIDKEVDKTAMVLSTVDDQGFPQGRIVLLKSILDGKFVFYTNYNSAKGKQLAGNNKASLTFYWPHLCQQIRIQGTVDKVCDQQSDAYFASRPIGSQIGAIVSNQSEMIRDRRILEQKYDELMASKEPFQRPEHWGGYALTPQKMEFWQGRNNRLHDRLLYTKIADGSWGRHVLQP